MKYQRPIQILVALLMVFTALSGITMAQAETAIATAVVVVRDLTYWDATYAGYVADTRFEKWPILFTDAEEFIVTAEPSAEGFNTLVILFDSNGNELARGSRTLTTSQPAGSYYVQVQPEIGAGFYAFTIRRVEVTPPPSDPAVATTVEPAGILLGEAAVVSVSLSNVPAEGYTSAEFTCTYDPAFVAVTGITATDLFGADAAVAINDPLASFIVAIAGSNGNKATTSGTAFTFTATALQKGETAINCQARVSKGDNTLTELPTTPATLTITEEVVPVDGTLNGQVLADKAVTVSLYNAENVQVATVAANEDGTFSITAPAGSYTVIATASGYLSALGSATIITNETATKPTITLVAGDIDGNNVIDQFDALTIGMSYNTAEPAAADLNNDGTINVLDLEILATNYRLSGPSNWE